MVNNFIGWCNNWIFILWFLSGYMGWYAYEKWKYRNASSTIQEAKKRGVFVRELNFSIDSFSGTLNNFKPFLEKGFKWGHHSLEGSDYRFQLSFDYRPTQELTISIRKSDLSKFDSSNSVWGYLKQPVLPDTIILEIRGENVKSGIIKVW